MHRGHQHDRRMACQPSQAPRAASSLKSPKPMPSLPVVSETARTPTATGSRRAPPPSVERGQGRAASPAPRQRPAHSRGRVSRSSGSRWCPSRSGQRHQHRGEGAPQRGRPAGRRTPADPANSSAGDRLDQRVAQADGARRPSSGRAGNSQLTGMFSNQRMRWPQAAARRGRAGAPGPAPRQRWRLARLLQAPAGASADQVRGRRHAGRGTPRLASSPHHCRSSIARQPVTTTLRKLPIRPRTPAPRAQDEVQRQRRQKPQPRHRPAPSLKIGRYIETTMPPISTPRITMMKGSIRLDRP